MARILYLFGFAASAANLIVFLTIRGYGLAGSLIHPFFCACVALSLLIFFTRNIDHTAVRMLHVVVLAVVAALAIIDEYDSFFGVGFVILAALLAYKYDFLNRGLRWKLALSMVLTVVLIEISALIHHNDEAGSALGAAVYIVMFAAILYFIYKEDIDKYSDMTRSLESALENLKKKRSELERDLAEKNREIERFEKAILRNRKSDEEKLEEFRLLHGLTRKEALLIRVAYKTGGSNGVIAEEMGIKESTVKQHLNRIYGKMGVSGRSMMDRLVREFMAPRISDLLLD